MNCDLWFPTPIWSTGVDVDNKRIYEFCKNLQKTDPGRIISNHDGWQSNMINFDNYPELQSLSQEIFQYTAIALDGYKFNTQNKTLRLLGLWVNINNSKYSYNKSHIHGSSTISGVYYVKCNENSGKICFTKDPKEEYIIDTIGEVLEPATLNHAVAKYSPKEQHLLLFPSWVPHYVENNEDDEERISIAFNIGFI